MAKNSSSKKPDKRSRGHKSDDSYQWYSHEVEEVLNVIGVKRKAGLTESEVNSRKKKYGSNSFTEHKGPSFFSHLFDQLKSPLVLVLLVACATTAYLEEYIDSGVIAFALAIAVIIGVFQEGKASRAFDKLAHSQVHKATVLRQGARHEINAKEVVPGDIVILESGVQVPADIRIIEAKNLSINEAALTGEWLAVDKHIESVPVGASFSERLNMAWMGTFVAEGEGVGVVVATGDNTEVGQLAESLQSVVDEDTPLQMEIAKLSKIMLYVILALVIFLFAVGIYQGQSLHDMLLIAIAVAVASVPEGLPAAVAIVLAIGMESLLKRGGLVRSLLAAETLGSTTYVLTDKTGTLTKGTMALEGVIHSDVTNLSPDSWNKSEAVKEIIDTSLMSLSAYLDRTESNTDVTRGDPVEQAIFNAGIELNLVENSRDPYTERIDYLSFTSERRFAASLKEEENSSSKRLCINGAPEYLLDSATYKFTVDGPEPMTDEDRSEYLAAIEEQSSKGQRLIGVSYKLVDYSEIPINDETEKLLEQTVFMGVFILSDPVREGVKKAIEGVQAAGAKIILITGDNPQTALSIANKVGIAGRSETALTGDEIIDLTDEEVLNIMETVHVFARVLPKQKMRLAEILQSRGEIVAMTGDGINDSPALRKAHIGIALGSGTEVAKESADLVLVNDSFTIIYAAIEEGRRIIANIRKIVGYLLSTSLTEVVLIGAALLTGGAAPLLPAQILWANVIEEGLMSVAFAFEPGEKNAMKRTPQDIQEEGILSWQMISFMAFVITILSILTLSLYFYLRIQGASIEELRSAMFLAISIDSLFIAFSFRSLSTPIWATSLVANWKFLASFFVSSALLAIVLFIPFFQKLLSYQPLPLNDVLLVLSVSVGALITIELGKWIFFEEHGDSAKIA